MRDKLSFKDLNVPKTIGHNYIPLRVHSLEFLNKQAAADHKRLKVFHHKGVKCSNPACKREGCYVIVGKDPGGRIHKDVYTKDFTLMTVDHIIPKAAGGGEELENKQPMCEPCNSKKGCKVPFIKLNLTRDISSIG